MCVCARARRTTDCPPLSLLALQSSEGFIGLNLNAGKIEIYGSERQSEKGGRKRDRKGRLEGKTGLFEAWNLLLTLLLLLTQNFE